MRVTIDADPGEVARAVEQAVRAVAAAAVSDGGREDDIRERIAKAMGAERMGIVASDKTTWSVAKDAQKEFVDLYAQVMEQAQSRIVALLTQAAKDADKEHYLAKLRG